MSSRFSKHNDRVLDAVDKIVGLDYSLIVNIKEFKQVKLGIFDQGTLNGYGEYILPEIGYLYRGMFKAGYPE
jgi:hypothetical protein